ncbi:MAG: hypothetical protein ABI045_00060 [Flavobacteriales bacterium]
MSYCLFIGLGLGSKRYFADWSYVDNKEGVYCHFNIYDPVYGKINPSILPELSRIRSLGERS